MNIAKVALGSFAAGATWMYFSDPNRGKRRRVIVRDKVNAGLRDVARELDKAGRDLRNRSHGLASAVRSLVTRPFDSSRSSRVATVAYDHCRPAARRVSRASRTVAWPRSQRTFKTSSSESGMVGGRLAIGGHLKRVRSNPVPSMGLSRQRPRETEAGHG